MTPDWQVRKRRARCVTETEAVRASGDPCGQALPAKREASGSAGQEGLPGQGDGE